LHERLRLNKTTTSSITITLKVIKIRTAMTFVLKQPQKKEQNILHNLCKYIFRQLKIRTNALNDIREAWASA